MLLFCFGFFLLRLTLFVFFSPVLSRKTIRYKNILLDFLFYYTSRPLYLNLVIVFLSSAGFLMFLGISFIWPDGPDNYPLVTFFRFFIEFSYCLSEFSRLYLPMKSSIYMLSIFTLLISFFLATSLQRSYRVD